MIIIVESTVKTFTRLKGETPRTTAEQAPVGKTASYRPLKCLWLFVPLLLTFSHTEEKNFVEKAKIREGLIRS